MNLVELLKRGARIFPLACAAALAMLFGSEASYWQSVRTLNQLGVIDIARSGTQDLQQHILDAETGQRVDLPTGPPEHLKP